MYKLPCTDGLAVKVSVTVEELFKVAGSDSRGGT